MEVHPQPSLKGRTSAALRRVAVPALHLTLILLVVAACLAAARIGRERALEGMAGAAKELLASLDKELRARAVLPFGSAERRNWHFVPRAREGLALGRLSSEQKAAVHVLLRSALSSQGYIKVNGVLHLESILAELEGSPGRPARGRDPDRYCVTLFGTPGEGAWGWRFEGHHLSLNFTSIGGELVAETPFFLGAHPAVVPHGPDAGNALLGREEELARALYENLGAEARALATLPGAVPSDVLLGPGRDKGFEERLGLPFARMDEKQRAQAEKLLHEIVDDLPPADARRVWDRIASEGLDEIRFAWSGGTGPRDPHYWRLHGKELAIELDNTQDGANHIHLLWRDLSNDFGDDALRRHYEREHAPAKVDPSKWIKFHARILDESGAPLADERLHAEVNLFSGKSRETVRPTIRTDAEGRIELELEMDKSEQAVTLLSLHLPDAFSKPEWECSPQLLSRLPERSGERRHDLGEFRLCAPGSPSRYLGWSDDRLRSSYQALASSRSGYFLAHREHEAMLLEMVRRGGASWEEFLEQVLESEVSNEADCSSFGRETHDLEPLTALRRVQRRPDPLQLRFEEAGPFMAVFPEAPDLRVRLVNRDDRAFCCMDACGHGWRAEVIDPNGKPMPHGVELGAFRKPPGRLRMEPGEILETTLDLEWFVRFSSPGVHRVRMEYHDHVDMADLNDVRGLVRHSSSEFLVDFQPRTVELTRAEQRSLQECVLELDETAPVWFTGNRYREGLDVHLGRARHPAEKLLLSGWKSAVVLLDALEDPALSPGRRGWVLALLYDLIGLHHPCSPLNSVGSAVRSWIHVGFRPEDPDGPLFQQAGQGSYTGPLGPGQEHLTSVWRAKRPLLRTKLVD